MSGSEVTLLAEELARAVELTMNPHASQISRHEAYTACERFKETSPLCAQAGLFLAAAEHYSTIVRHFGLQLMEHTIKYRWTHISQQEKVFIKVVQSNLIVFNIIFGPQFLVSISIYAVNLKVIKLIIDK